MRLLAALAAACALAPCAAAQAAPRRALLVLVPASAGTATPAPAPDALLRSLAARPPLAVGLLSPTQGTYSPEQAMLDITQGARSSPSAYRTRRPGPLALTRTPRGWAIRGWAAAVRRASTARAELVPGLLASAVPSGAGFAAVRGQPTLGAVAAADRLGRVAAVSLGPRADVAARARRLLGAHRFVVVSLPDAGPLAALLNARAPGDLIVVLQAPPDISQIPLLATAVEAPGAAGRGLISDTTHTAGLVAGIDVLPTVLRHLGRPITPTVTGQQIRFGPRRDAAALETLRTRYTQPAPRRVRTLLVLLAVAGLLVAALAALGGRAGARRGLRLAALTFMWVPSVVLVPAVLVPASALAEVTIVVAGAFALAALTDAVAPWPRGPLLPAAACLIVYTLDLAAATHLVDRSLLGPNPRAGARFFGIGNELEPALPVALFAGLAAAWGPRGRSRGMALTFAVLGTALAVVVGSGYLGADVGGVLTISAGTAVATLAVLPGRITRRSVLVAACVPFAAVAALALLDLLTHASSHFARSVLEVNGAAGLWALAVRRYDFAYQALTRGLMPLATAGALVAAVAGVAWRDRLYAGAPGPAWHAALLGGLAAGVVGALTNDSGPLLFVVAVFTLAVITAYLSGNPAAGAVSSAAARGHEGSMPATRPPEPMRESPSSRDHPEGGRPPAPVP